MESPSSNYPAAACCDSNKETYKPHEPGAHALAPLGYTSAAAVSYGRRELMLLPTYTKIGNVLYNTVSNE